MNTKICTKCKKEKPLNEFYLRCNGKYYRSTCKECDSKKYKQYYKIKKKEV